MTRSAVIAREKRVLARQCVRANGALDRVRVELDAAIVKERDQAGPMAKRIAHGHGQLRDARDALDMNPQPVMQRLDDRPTSALLTWPANPRPPPASAALAGDFSNPGLGRATLHQQDGGLVLALT